MLSMGPFGYPLDYLLWWALYLSLLLHTWCYFKLAGRSRRRRRLRVFVGNGLIFLCLGGCAALAGESYFRFLSVDLDPFGMSMPSRRWFAIHVKLNSMGCRDREWTQEKPPGVRRIAFVGDSFVYGWGVERTEDRFSNRVGAALSRSPNAVEVLNVAKPGWDTGAQIQPVADMIDVFGADEIVLCYVFNDIEKLLPRDGDFDPTRPPLPRFFNPDGSCLLDALYRSVVVPRIASVRNYHDWLAAGFADARTWEQHQQQLAAIVRICRERNVVLRVVLLPFLKVGGTGFDRAALHARVGAFFEAQGVAVADLLPVVEGRDVDVLVVNRLDAHPNEEAHRLFAEEILRKFYRELEH